MTKILMIAGEASADKHASAVIRALREKIPQIEIFGMGGPEMAAAGMECLYGMDEVAVMGITDVIPKIKHIIQVFQSLKRLIDVRQPDVVIPVDLPDFNMHIARAAKKRGKKVLYYIAPQIWAWRRYRAHTLAAVTDGIAVIFPFEEKLFRSYGVNARYVGHPLLENDPPFSTASWPPKKIGILPGSRKHEIKKILPVMLKAKRIIQEKRPELAWCLPIAPGLEHDFFRAMIDDDISLTSSPVLPRLNLAMVKSGTATLELALRGVPHCIAYRTSHINYLLARTFVRVDHIGMPNIIAEKRIVPELIQHECTPQALAQELSSFIQDSSLYEKTRDSFKTMRKSLGSQKASQGVANWVVSMLPH